MYSNNNSNNNNNIQDSVYGAVTVIIIHDTVIARVHPVHLMNIEQCQATANPQAKPTDVGCESAGRHESYKTYRCCVCDCVCDERCSEYIREAGVN